MVSFCDALVLSEAGGHSVTSQSQQSQAIALKICRTATDLRVLHSAGWHCQVLRTLTCS